MFLSYGHILYLDKVLDMFTITGKLMGVKEKLDANGVGSGKYKAGVSVPKLDGFDGEETVHVVSIPAKLAATNILPVLHQAKDKIVSLPVMPQVWKQGDRSGMWIELLGPPAAPKAEK